MKIEWEWDGGGGGERKNGTCLRSKMNSFLAGFLYAPTLHSKALQWQGHGINSYANLSRTKHEFTARGLHQTKQNKAQGAN